MGHLCYFHHELRREGVKIYQCPYFSLDESFILSMAVTEKLGPYSRKNYILPVLWSLRSTLVI